MYYPNAYWKRMARAALRNNWLTALLIALTVNLPSLLIQGISSAAGYNLSARMQAAIYAAINESGAVDTALLQAGLEEVLQTPGVWIAQVLGILAWLLTPCLSMGMYAWMLGRPRGESGPWTSVFSRLSLFGKAVLLRLWVTLRILVWMLPGVALSVLSLLPLWTANSSSRISVLSSANTSLGLLSFSAVVMMVLGIAGALRYQLSDVLMADQPQLKVREAARQCAAMMKGHVLRLFSLMLSFILLYLLESLLVNFVLDAFGAIPGLMTEMLCSLALQVYMGMTLCAFFLTLRGEEVTVRPAVPEEEPLN